MRGLSSLASRASPAIKNLSEEAYNHRKFNKENPTKRKRKAALNPRPTDKLATPSTALFKAGRDGEGNRYLNEMVQVGLVSNAFSYNMVIDCFCKASMMDRASETFREMKESGIDPNIVTFNTLISGYSKNGEIGKARALLEMLLDMDWATSMITGRIEELLPRHGVTW